MGILADIFPVSLQCSRCPARRDFAVLGDIVSDAPAFEGWLIGMGWAPSPPRCPDCVEKETDRGPTG